MSQVLKWAGGKSKLIGELLKVLPEGDRLVEPFVGGASVFMGTGYERYLLGDVNKDLIDLYKLIKKGGGWYVGELGYYFTQEYNTAAAYYSIRDAFNENKKKDTYSKFEKCRQFLYLNRHGYNGLCRYNSKGGYNVPFGKYKRPYYPEKEIRDFRGRSVNAEFVLGDFKKTMMMATLGDVVYCDPPYSPFSNGQSFTAYWSNFGHEEHLELVGECERLAAMGVPCVVSNHDTPTTRELYSGASRMVSIKAGRSISRNGEGRGKVGELVVVYD